MRKFVRLKSRIQNDTQLLFHSNYRFMETNVALESEGFLEKEESKISFNKFYSVKFSAIPQ